MLETGEKQREVPNNRSAPGLEKNQSGLEQEEKEWWDGVSRRKKSQTDRKTLTGV